MKVQDKTKCMNPWLGLLMIAGICLIMVIAVFFEFKAERQQKRQKRRQAQKQRSGSHKIINVNFQQKNFNNSSNNRKNTIIF